MFGLSFSEIILIGIIAVVVFGPKQLPEVAKTLGKFFAKFRHESEKVRKEFYNSIYEPADFIKREQKKITSKIENVIKDTKDSK